MKKLVPFAAATTAAVLALTAAPALADPSTAPSAAAKTGKGLDAAKKVVTARLDGRLETLRALSTAIGGATHLTTDHKTALNTIVDNDQKGLTALKTKVAGETTTAAVKADAKSMVDDFRVFMLVVPQVHLVIAIDLETAAANALTKAAGSQSDVKSDVSAATAAINGKAGTLLAVKPSPDADAMKGAVTPVRQAVHTARADLKKARKADK